MAGEKGTKTKCDNNCLDLFKVKLTKAGMSNTRAKLQRFFKGCGRAAWHNAGRLAVAGWQAGGACLGWSGHAIQRIELLLKQCGA